MTTHLPVLLTHKQAAEALGTTEGNLRVMRCFGKGPRFIKTGHYKNSRVFYDPADIAAWLNEHKYQSTSAYAAEARAKDAAAMRGQKPAAPSAPVSRPWERPAA